VTGRIGNPPPCSIPTPASARAAKPIVASASVSPEVSVDPPHPVSQAMSQTVMTPAPSNWNCNRPFSTEFPCGFENKSAIRMVSLLKVPIREIRLVIVHFRTYSRVGLRPKTESVVDVNGQVIVHLPLCCVGRIF